ncbi:MAG TPA: D-glycerate dehydrogenase [Patescibacteria group bacterium]
MKVFITRTIPGPAETILKDAGFDVEVNRDDKVLSKDELLTKVKGVDGILSLLTDRIDGEVFDAAGDQLKVVANYAAGFDNIDTQECKKRNVAVTNTGGATTQVVAEHSVALMLAVARRLVEGDKFVRQGRYKKWDPKLLLGYQMLGKTCGIVGLGKIGAYFGKIVHAGFEMKIVYYDTVCNEQFEGQFDAKCVSIEELLKVSDVVSLNVPLLASTKHLINSQRLKLMKPDAILINTSRGPVVDENALVEALKNKLIAGAGLDVFENEPDLASGLTELENIVLTPHIGSSTIESRTKMSEIAAKNILAVLTGQKPSNLVI